MAWAFSRLSAGNGPRRCQALAVQGSCASLARVVFSHSGCALASLSISPSSSSLRPSGPQSQLPCGWQCLRDVTDGVLYLLCHEPADRSMGEELIIVLVEAIDGRRALVGLAQANDPNQMFAIEAALLEISSQGIQKFGIGGRIRRAEIIHGLDNATPHEVPQIRLASTRAK